MKINPDTALGLAVKIAELVLHDLQVKTGLSPARGLRTWEHQKIVSHQQLARGNFVAARRQNWDCLNL